MCINIISNVPKGTVLNKLQIHTHNEREREREGERERGREREGQIERGRQGERERGDRERDREGERSRERRRQREIEFYNINFYLLFSGLAFFLLVSCHPIIYPTITSWSLFLILFRSSTHAQIFLVLVCPVKFRTYTPPSVAFPFAIITHVPHQPKLYQFYSTNVRKSYSF